MQGKQIDEFFRRGLAEPNIPFEEEHWYVLQEELEKRKKRRRVIAWWTRTGGIAAMLVMGLFLWNYQKQDSTTQVVKAKPVVQQQDIKASESVPVLAPEAQPEITQRQENKVNTVSPAVSQHRVFTALNNSNSA